MLSTPKYISAKGAMQLQNVEVRQMGQAYQLGRWVTGQAYQLGRWVTGQAY